MMSNFIEEILDWNDGLGAVLALVFVVVLVIIGLIGGAAWLGWHGSCRGAQIYNRLNHTDYTCSDLFWASDQINKGTYTIKQEDQ